MQNLHSFANFAAMELGGSNPKIIIHAVT